MTNDKEMREAADKAAKAYVKTLPGLQYKSLYDFGMQNIAAFKAGAKWQAEQSGNPGELAVKFGKWLSAKYFTSCFDKKDWRRDGKYFSTSELYQLFINEREGKG